MMKIFPEQSQRSSVETTTQKIYEVKLVMKGLQDLEAGRTVDGERAIQRIREKYNI